jgi:protein-S-isoprenylcysteine O-methyltransferase Ste14
LVLDDHHPGRPCLTFTTTVALETIQTAPFLSEEQKRDNPENVTTRHRTRTVSRLTAFVLVWALGVPLAHGVLPWAMSLLSRRAGWNASGPGLLNVLGVVPVGLGIAGLGWIMVVASVESPRRIELRSAAFLMTGGPYAFSRNPMYVSELTLWLGWGMFYGSVGVLIGFGILLVALVASVPYEERVLEARFGEAYRTYRNAVPRWLGRRRQPESRRPHS